MNIGDVFSTNQCGECEVIDYKGCFNVLVRFLDTGTECVTSSDQLRKGTVKDRMLPSLCGIGFLGGKVPYTESIYGTWASMIRRCYEPNSWIDHPTYKDCYVCKEWHNFSNYHKWYVKNYIEGFEIDKDKKIKGNRVYSPETCLFLSTKENMQVAFARKYELTHKNGIIIQISNMSEFCKSNGLTPSGITRVKNGKRKSHKGWVKVVKLN